MIILARHGQTLWNKEKRLQGWLNSPLSDLGIAQAKNVASKIIQLVNPNEVEIVSSPLGRAFETAKIIAAALTIHENNINTTSLLKEFSFGIWEGMTMSEVKETHFVQWNNRAADKWNYQIPQGESYRLIAKRAEQWLENTSDTETKIAVSHQVIGRVIRGIYLGLDEHATMSLIQENNHIITLKHGQENLIVA